MVPSSVPEWNGNGKRRNVRSSAADGSEIRLDENWTGVDVDLAQGRVAGVYESMRRVCRDDDDTAGFHFALLVADRDGGAALESESDLHVGMGVQRRALTRPGIDDVGRKRRALSFTDKLMRHSSKRQLLNVQEAHGESDERRAIKDKEKNRRGCSADLDGCRAVKFFGTLTDRFRIAFYPKRRSQPNPNRKNIYANQRCEKKFRLSQECPGRKCRNCPERSSARDGRASASRFPLQLDF